MHRMNFEQKIDYYIPKIKNLKIKELIEMKINIEKNNEMLTLKIEGRLDTATAPELEKTINEQSEGTKDLVMDMEKLEYISSAGLRVLLAVQKKMNKVGTMKLTHVCDAVMEVFEMTGFSDILVFE